ncbi:MAG: hypothetical protein A3H43_05795 [Gammaproteobacteria bacterium RIFCSPLOWO2_02_FULL_42_9]|nr:MAG: hypothetical protein A3H43_05795 [Gammaproteobacteria bacterium RIFCSPLOWO2_02_FULL_42_9]
MVRVLTYNLLIWLKIFQFILIFTLKNNDLSPIFTAGGAKWEKVAILLIYDVTNEEKHVSWHK